MQRHLIFERSTRILCPHLRTLQFCHFRTATVSLPQSEAQAPDTRNIMQSFTPNKFLQLGDTFRPLDGHSISTV